MNAVMTRFVLVGLGPRARDTTGRSNAWPCRGTGTDGPDS